MQLIHDGVRMEPDRGPRGVVAQVDRGAPVVLITGCSTGIGRAAAAAPHCDP
jgi:hypothetical protein